MFFALTLVIVAAFTIVARAAVRSRSSALLERDVTAVRDAATLRRLDREKPIAMSSEEHAEREEAAGTAAQRPRTRRDRSR